MKPESTKFDIYQQVTDQIIAAIEGGVDGSGWRRPWHTTGGCNFSPINVQSRKPYRGVNTVCLWAAAQSKGYTTGEWATYKQWADRGAQVRKGEKSTLVVFWKFSAKGQESQDGDGASDQPALTGRQYPVMVRGYHVFNAAQVDGYELPAVEEITGPERNAACDAFFQAVGADLRHGGNSAHYAPMDDYIQMPHLAAFKDSESYYGTLAHEHTHWTGRSNRLDRDLSKRFGSEGYAAEELIAELGAAMLCGHLIEQFLIGVSHCGTLVKSPEAGS